MGIVTDEQESLCREFQAEGGRERMLEHMAARQPGESGAAVAPPASAGARLTMRYNKGTVEYLMQLERERAELLAAISIAIAKISSGQIRASPCHRPTRIPSD